MNAHEPARTCLGYDGSSHTTNITRKGGHDKRTNRSTQHHARSAQGRGDGCWRNKPGKASGAVSQPSSLCRSPGHFSTSGANAGGPCQGPWGRGDCGQASPVAETASPNSSWLAQWISDGHIDSVMGHLLGGFDTPADDHKAARGHPRGKLGAQRLGFLLSHESPSRFLRPSRGCCGFEINAGQLVCVGHA